MIDFNNSQVFKLKPIGEKEAVESVQMLLTPGETVAAGFKTVRDKVIFTSKRIIAINVQGITGKKIDYTSIPYSKIQTFSIETAGTFDLDSELDIWLSGLGKVRFEILGAYDIRYLNRIISEYVLG